MIENNWKTIRDKKQMNKLNWRKAPHYAQFFSGGRFRKHRHGVEFFYHEGEWIDNIVFNDLPWHQEQPDFEMRPEREQSIKPGDTVVYLLSGEEYFYVGRTIGGNHAMQTSNGILMEFNFLEGFEIAKSDRDKWIEQASGFVNAAHLSGLDPMGNLYNAMKTGALPKP